MNLTKINKTQITELLLQTRQKSWCCGKATLKIQRGKTIQKVTIETIPTIYGRKQLLYMNENPVKRDTIIKSDILNSFDNKYVKYSLNS